MDRFGRAELRQRLDRPLRLEKIGEAAEERRDAHKDSSRRVRCVANACQSVNGHYPPTATSGPLSARTQGPFQRQLRSYILEISNQLKFDRRG